MGIRSEFREFAVKRNSMDMAIGMMIGASFGNLVSCFVKTIVMPPIIALFGGVKFSDLTYVLNLANNESEAITLRYGQFIQSTIDFTIVASAIVLMVKLINSLKNREESIQASIITTKEEQLLKEIRDLLREKN